MVNEIYLLDDSNEKVYFYSNSISFENAVKTLCKSKPIKISEGKIECGEGSSYKLKLISLNYITFDNLILELEKNCTDYFIYSLKGTIEEDIEFEIYDNEEIHIFINKNKVNSFLEVISEIIYLELGNHEQANLILNTIRMHNGCFCEIHNSTLLRVSKNQLT